MMNKTLLKTSLRDIRSTPGRFLSLMTIILLGVAFFVGISATGPDMKQAAQSYYQKTHLANLMVYVPFGADAQLVTAVKEESGVSKVETQFMVDVTQADQQAVIRLLSYDDNQLNQAQLVAGKMPEKKNEIVLDALAQDQTGYKIGDQLTFEQTDALKDATYTIVGYVHDPEFLSKDNRGTTTLKNGSLSYFAYGLPEIFKATLPNRLVIGFADPERDHKTQERELKTALDRLAKEELTKQSTALPEAKRMQFLQQRLVYTTRADLPGYEEYEQNADRIASLATVFPVIFFFVAALISLTSVSRMVEEKRLEIGTYFALGYRPTEIAWKFLLYVTLACVTGVLFGLAIGFALFPKIIIEAYGVVYDIIGYQTPWQWPLVLIASGVSLLCTVGVAIFVVRVELIKVPAVLMRPKAPKAGKKILLERMGFLWRKLSFTYKVMFRNLFRYKARAWMTILGIAGCTAMILTGFGLKDSISEMIPLQFDKIWHYEAVVSLASDNQAAVNQIKKTRDVDQTLSVAMQEVTTTSKAYAKQTVSLIVPEQLDDVASFYHFIEPTQDKTIALSQEGAIVTQKLAQLFSLQVGDPFVVKTTDNKEIKVKIAGITENYVNHAVYLSPAYYQKVADQKPDYTTVLVRFKTGLSTVKEDQLASTLMENPQIVNVSFLSKAKAELESSLGVLTIVMWVLIVSAGLLAFIVLYSLNTMSVAERMRELSTIKVLGFYDREVTFYIVRENIILATIGMVLGSLLGVLLHAFVIGTVEMDTTMFSKTIQPMSYVYSIVLTYIFVGIVALATHRALQKINMLDALKANE